MQIISKKIEEIKEYENNPRNNDNAVEYVARSIKDFGFKIPIIVDKNNVIVAGHTRYKAAKELNLTEVPCIVADDLTDEQIKAFRLVDNKSAELAEWNLELLNIELENIHDIDMNLYNFELSELLDNVIEDDYEIELPEEPKTKHGDIYKLGNHYLMCGDSTKESDVAKLMNNNKADLFLTDPPYNVALGNHDTPETARQRHRRTDGLIIMNDKMSDNDFLDFLTKCFSIAKDNMKDGASFYIWHADNESLTFRQALKNSGLELRQTLIWNKNAITLGRQDYQWKHEPCLYGWKDGASHSWFSDRSQPTVLDFKKPSKSENHPTMKPIELFAYQIKNSSKANDIILDTFGGSGTSIIACEQLNRICFTMELDPRYCDVIVDRWETFTNQKAELISGDQ
jgi:site-specific DNA-methyltransferase (adenine-specific)|nr:MAG TPA: adenine specific DNA methyltransferase [Caudoviricetes sp.]